MVFVLTFLSDTLYNYVCLLKNKIGDKKRESQIYPINKKKFTLIYIFSNLKNMTVSLHLPHATAASFHTVNGEYLK